METNTLVLIALVFGLAALVAAGFNFWMLKGLNTLRKNFFTGTSARDLESVLNELSSGLSTLQENQVILEGHLKNLRSDFSLSVQKVGLIKFNPFEGSSGNLSFCLALLDGKNTGTVITCIHGREQNRIYTKQITEGKYEIQLTDEELKAIELANNNFQKFISK